MKLSDERLKEIRERCEKATPGPWEASYRGTLEVAEGSVHLPGDELLTPIIEDNNNVTIRGELRWEDADFTAHARTDIPDLLEALEEARAELRELRERERWIPVGEKDDKDWPEYGSCVLVRAYDRSDDRKIEWTDIASISYMGGWFVGDNKYGKQDVIVTHWRPLPPPPEEER